MKSRARRVRVRRGRLVLRRVSRVLKIIDVTWVMLGRRGIKHAFGTG